MSKEIEKPENSSSTSQMDDVNRGVMNKFKLVVTKNMTQISGFSKYTFNKTINVGQQFSDNTVNLVSKGKKSTIDQLQDLSATFFVGFQKTKNFSGDKIEQFLQSEIYTSVLSVESLKKTDKYLGHVMLVPFTKYPNVFIVLISIQIIVKLLIKLKKEDVLREEEEDVNPFQEIALIDLENKKYSKKTLIAQLKIHASKIKITDLIMVTDLLLQLPVTNKFKLIRKIKFINSWAKKMT